MAFLAGTLDQGGSEKQLVYMARALRERGVEVVVYCLTQGEFYERVLRDLGFAVIFVGRLRNPLLRVVKASMEMSGFRPHVIQASHSFVNLHAALAAPLLGAVSLGALRSSLLHSRQANRGWTRWLITAPTGLLVNSQAAIRDVVERSLCDRRRIYYLPNAVDLADYETGASPVREGVGGTKAEIRVIFLGRLVGVKRLDRFLEALSRAARQERALKGIVVGEGPERAAMERKAAELGLGSGTVSFLGQRGDVPELLRGADALVLSSEQEGFPNVLLEAMAAGLPVITTSVGDAPDVVQDGVTGYVVAAEDVDGMAQRIVLLARSKGLRERLGAAGRKRVVRFFNFERFGVQLLAVYRNVAERASNRRLLAALQAHESAFDPRLSQVGVG